ncbi:hypothetical protein [Marinomonas sp. GJ51-6]|uniref:hypothetical protein n=1 Tax=Marinomonas sp. GJ51-6 TaxID=2992802 RepID=UPI0039775857
MLVCLRQTKRFRLIQKNLKQPTAKQKKTAQIEVETPAQLEPSDKAVVETSKPVELSPEARPPWEEAPEEAEVVNSDSELTAEPEMSAEPEVPEVDVEPSEEIAEEATQPVDHAQNEPLESTEEPRLR